MTAAGGVNAVVRRIKFDLNKVILEKACSRLPEVRLSFLFLHSKAAKIHPSLR
jgi:hypothetical protein